MTGSGFFSFLLAALDMMGSVGIGISSFPNLLMGATGWAWAGSATGGAADFGDGAALPVPILGWGGIEQ